MIKLSVHQLITRFFLVKLTTLTDLHCIHFWIHFKDKKKKISLFENILFYFFSSCSCRGPDLHLFLKFHKVPVTGRQGTEAGKPWAADTSGLYIAPEPAHSIRTPTAWKNKAHAFYFLLTWETGRNLIYFLHTNYNEQAKNCETRGQVSDRYDLLKLSAKKVK